MQHPSALSTENLLKSCSIHFQRRSGPGGQNRNKVETAVILIHVPTQIRAEANERRSQAENKTVALFRLRLKLALEIRLSPTAPSPLWKSRIRGEKISINPKHTDFPTLLAEGLDLLTANGMEMSVTARQLGCTSSQLCKFIQLEPRAIQLVNQRRTELGMKSYR